MQETARFSITAIYKYLIPFGTPAPSAFVMGINLHKFMVAAIGTEYGWLAWLVAVIGVLGIEGVGGMSSILVSRSYVSKNYGIMRWAFLAVFGYAACVVVGIWAGGDSRAMVVTVILTLLGYFVMAMWEGLQGAKEQHAEEIETIYAETELARQQASIARATARAAKSTGYSGQVSGVRSTSDGRKARGLNPETLQKVREYIQVHPDKVSVRDLEKAKIIGHSQAAEYIKAARSEEK